MGDRTEPINFLYAGLLFVVSFIALFGFLAKAAVVVRVVWELAFLILGLLIVKTFADKAKMFKLSALFYAVNLVVLIIAKFFIAGNITTNIFFVLGIVLMAAGFAYSIMQTKEKKAVAGIQIPKVEVSEQGVAKIEEAPETTELEEAPKVETYGKKTVKKTAKKVAKKKTAKKKAKKKAKK